MKRIYSELRTILSFAFLAKRSNYSFKDKIKVYKFLLSNHFKNKFVRNEGAITQKIFDYNVTAYDYGTLQFLFKEIFLANDYYFDTLKSSPQIIDCGANIGMAILFFKKAYPNCSIMAFEPNPYAFELLEKNVKQNNLTKVQLFNIGLSNISGEIDFFISENKGTLVGSFIKERGGKNKITVKTQKLSSFINTNVFDLIKIDIEGAEIEVIDDLATQGKLEQCERYIIEYHHRINREKSKFSHFLKHFEDTNYEYNIKTFGDIGSFQDILLNLYKDENIANNI
jgi:FkbM family methyltransferase